MAVLINGNGNEAIYAQQDADWYAALMGGVTMITAVGQQFAYELLDANTIGVKDGVIITKEGRRIQVDTNVIDTFDIPTGAQGTTNYYIIGYHLVTDEQSVQTAETFVQLMENGTDTIPEGSFKEGDDDVFVSLYRVEQNDLTIGTLTLLLPTVSESMQQQISTINADLSDISADLDNKQNTTDNSLTTTSKQIVGAINELNTVKTISINAYQPMSGVYAGCVQCGKIVEVNAIFTTSQAYGAGTILFEGCPAGDWLNRFLISRMANNDIVGYTQVGINAQGQIECRANMPIGYYELHCTYIAR